MGQAADLRKWGVDKVQPQRLMMENILIICSNLTLQRKIGNLQLNDQILFFTPLFTEYQRKVHPVIHFRK